MHEEIEEACTNIMFSYVYRATAQFYKSGYCSSFGLILSRSSTTPTLAHLTTNVTHESIYFCGSQCYLSTAFSAYHIILFRRVQYRGSLGCFYPHLVSILFAGPSLHHFNFYRKIFTPILLLTLVYITNDRIIKAEERCMMKKKE